MPLMLLGLVLSIPFVMALLWTIAPAALAIGCLWLCWRRLRDGEWPSARETPEDGPSTYVLLQRVQFWEAWIETHRDDPDFWAEWERRGVMPGLICDEPKGE